MLKTKRTAMMLALGLLFVLFTTAFAAAPAQARMSRTASAPTTSQQIQAGWSGWSQVPGNGFTVSGPAALGNYVFVRGTNNRIYMNTFNGTTWSGWREVPGHGLTLSAPAVKASTSGSDHDLLNLFVRGTDNKIYENTLRDSGWSGWSEVPGHGFTLDSPAVVGDSLFVRGTNNRIYTNTIVEITWSGWSEVPGNGFTLSGPTAASYLPGTDRASLSLLVRGTNDHIYVNTRIINERDGGWSWSGWREVPGHGLTPSAPGVVVYGFTLQLFVRGTDNKIYTNPFNGTSWSGWSEVPGHGLTPDAPGATMFDNNKLYLYVRGTNDRIYLNVLQVTP